MEVRRWCRGVVRAENKDLEVFIFIGGEEGGQQVSKEQWTTSEMTFAQWVRMPWTG